MVNGAKTRTHVINLVYEFSPADNQSILTLTQIINNSAARERFYFGLPQNFSR